MSKKTFRIIAAITAVIVFIAAGKWFNTHSCDEYIDEME